MRNDSKIPVYSPLYNVAAFLDDMKVEYQRIAVGDYEALDSVEKAISSVCETMAKESKTREHDQAKEISWAMQGHDMTDLTPYSATVLKELIWKHGVRKVEDVLNIRIGITEKCLQEEGENEEVY